MTKTLRERVQEVAECAVHAEKATGFPAEFLGAQAALESAWHAQMPKNAPFGRKASPRSKNKELCLTCEWLTSKQVEDFVRSGGVIVEAVETRGDRVKYLVKDWFETFESIKDAYVAHARWLQTSPRYRPVWEASLAMSKKREDWVRFLASGIANAGYATTASEEYAKSLIGIALGGRLRDAILAARGGVSNST